MLKEDDGLIKPIEMVELLVTNFLGTLNPELFPKDDRPSKSYVCLYDRGDYVFFE